MNKRKRLMVGVVFFTSTLFAQHSLEAYSLNGLVTGFFASIKNCLSPVRIKMMAEATRHALASTMRTVAITTVIANIVLPSRLKRRLGEIPLIGRFMFMHERGQIQVCIPPAPVRSLPVPKSP